MNMEQRGVIRHTEERRGGARLGKAGQGGAGQGKAWQGRQWRTELSK